jgi:hypothetical protein
VSTVIEVFAVGAATIGGAVGVAATEHTTTAEVVLDVVGTDRVHGLLDAVLIAAMETVMSHKVGGATAVVRPHVRLLPIRETLETTRALGRVPVAMLATEAAGLADRAAHHAAEAPREGRPLGTETAASVQGHGDEMITDPGMRVVGILHRPQTPRLPAPVDARRHPSDAGIQIITADHVRLHAGATAAARPIHHLPRAHLAGAHAVGPEESLSVAVPPKIAMVV